MNRDITSMSRMWILVLFVSSLFYSCGGEHNQVDFEMKQDHYIFENGVIKVEVNNTTGLLVYRKSADISLSFISEDNVRDYIVINGISIDQFTVDHERTEVLDVESQFGTGKRLLIIARADGPEGSLIEKQLSIDLYDEFPHSAIINNIYLNVNATEGLTINKEVNSQFTLDASLIDKQ